MIKKDKKYKKLDLKQSILKSTLHQNIRDFLKSKEVKSRSKKKKPLTMMLILGKLEKQEAKINIIRKQIGKTSIHLIKDLKSTFKHY